MAESPPPADEVRSESTSILTLTRTSIATSTIVLFLSSSYVPPPKTWTSFFGLTVSLLTIIYHNTTLIQLYRHRNPPYPPLYPSMHASTELAIFLLYAWFVTAGFVLYNMVATSSRWGIPDFVVVGITACLAVVETGVLLAFILLCGCALQSREAAEQGGRIQI